MKSNRLWNIVALVILIFAIAAAVQMFYLHVSLGYSLGWHWLLIGCFLLALIINLRTKRVVGVAIGLGGVILLVTSLVIEAF